jgi:hypothetical protein
LALQATLNQQIDGKPAADFGHVTRGSGHGSGGATVDHQKLAEPTEPGDELLGQDFAQRFKRGITLRSRNGRTATAGCSDLGAAIGCGSVSSNGVLLVRIVR